MAVLELRHQSQVLVLLMPEVVVAALLTAALKVQEEPVVAGTQI
jgi:hypothetical protein